MTPIQDSRADLVQSTQLPSLPGLAERIRAALRSPEVGAGAERIRHDAQERGLVSDWEGSPEKVDTFARLVIAAQSILGPGSTLETGVCKGGTSALLIACAPQEAFHIAIDPFGLPSQSYANRAKYGRWRQVRDTLFALTQLGRESGVTVLPYVMSSQAFIGANLLQHEGPIRIVHLDGDHSADAVTQELRYFRSRVTSPALFILDDHDAHFPGVEEGLQRAGQGLISVLHERYDFPGYGEAGFSAWLHLSHHE
jgi:hypothetical protein